MKSLLASSGSLCKTSSHSIRPGWNVFVSELHAEARRAFKNWDVAGKIRHGPSFEYKTRANATFKYAIPTKTSLPTNIDGVSGVNEITKLWQEHLSSGRNTG